MPKKTLQTVDSPETSSLEIRDQVPEEAGIKDRQETKVIYRIFQGKDIRFEKSTDGEVMAVALDVAKILGYENPDQAIKQHCRATAKIVIHDGKQNRPMLVIPERDIYRLVMQSTKSEARKFEEWVVGEVLPSIRQTGKYKITRKINYVPQTTNDTAKPGEQLEFFPRHISMTFAEPVTLQLAKERARLKAEGKEFKTDKDFIGYIVAQYFEEVV